MNYHEDLINECSKWVGIQEQGVNSGPEVQMFQKYVDQKANKEAWCASFVMYCIGQIETRRKIRTRLFKTEHVLTMWNNTPKELRSPRPSEGLIVVWNYVGTSSGHCGVITKVHKDSVETIEGNTSPSIEVEREGDGVYKKRRKLVTTTSKMKIVGFIDPFANLARIIQTPSST